MSDHIQGPAWDLSDEYASLDDPAFAMDRRKVEEFVARIEGEGKRIGEALPRAASISREESAEEYRALLAACRSSTHMTEEAWTLLGNLRTYVNCLLSVDGGNSRGKELRGVLSVLGSRLEGASASLNLFLVLSPEPFVEDFLADPEVSHHRFRIRQERKLREQKLSLESERLLASMSPDGFSAWGSLYDTLTGTLSCTVGLPAGERVMGLAGAASLLKGPLRPVRESAWRAINGAFAAHAETCAAMLNAIAGWRRTEYALRSSGKTLHFLDPALHQNRMKLSTLEAMIGVVDESREIGRAALRAQARLMGVERLAPWDLLAACPKRKGGEEPSATLSFERGLDVVARAYGEVDPSMADFVRETAAARRIEGRSMPGKRPGAFCTEFPKSRNPRVYMTYGGSLSEVSTLAHELGHAYHSTLLRDLSLAESDYPMSLAETASTFAEAALGELLAREASDEAARLEVAWSEAQDAATFLLNIPARLDFEKCFYEARTDKPLGPDALSTLMSEAWKKYYGAALSEYDDLFWCSKLHFYKTGVSFYNFPYTFGYLFSLGVYAKRESLGPDFHKAYTALLRDSGRMEVEELASKHLGADLGDPEFWRGSVKIVRANVERFGTLVESLLEPQA